MATISWGILGTGRMAATMAVELRTPPLRQAGAELVAVASRSAASATEFAARFGIGRVHGSYAQLAADPRVDAVYIATPPSEHAAHMRLCLEGGKAVLCEKPFTVDAKEARTIVELARSRRLFLMEAMWTRFLPAVVTLQDLLRERVIGQPLLAVGGGAFMPTYEPGYYLFNKELGGGVLLDAGVYLISLCSLLLGSVRRVQASGELGPQGVDDHEAFILDHEQGARSVLYVSLRTRRPPDLELLGTSGRIQIHAPIYRPTQLTVNRGFDRNETLKLPVVGSGYGNQVLAAMAALRQGKLEVAELPLDESVAIMSVMDEIGSQLRSAQREPGRLSRGSF